ncbi:hypothetical protein MPH_13416, partial [Macrophomina phaseolina MS6]
ALFCFSFFSLVNFYDTSKT